MIIPVFALHRTDKFDSAGSVPCAGNYSSAYEAGSIKLQQSVMALFRQCIRLLYATMLWAHDMAKRPRVYSFEAATRDLAADGISNLVFTLDSPVSAVLHASTLEGLGRFFFHRDRQAVSVTAVTLQRRRCEHDASCLSAIAAIRNFVALQFERTRHDRARLAAARCGTGQALALPQLRNRQYRRARLREHGAIGRRGQRSLARRFQVLRGG